MMKKAAEKAAATRIASLSQNAADPARRPNDQPARDGLEPANGDSTTQVPGNGAQPLSAPEAHPSERPIGSSSGATPEAPPSQRQPWECLEEVLQVLKTSFPLLLLSLETMVDQIQHKFKLSTEEDIYRNISMLLQDAIQVFSRPRASSTLLKSLISRTMLCG